LVTAVVVLGACRERSPSGTQPSPMTAQANAIIGAMRDLHASVPSGEDFGSSRDAWYKRFGLIYGHLRVHPDGPTMDAAVDFLGNDWVQKRQNDPEEESFVSELQCATLARLISAGEGARLTKMLAILPMDTNMPDGCYVEYALASGMKASGGEDSGGIVVLFDAYGQAGCKESREANLASLRRAFNTEVRKDESPAEFVARCREWCTAHKGQVKVNPEYHDTYLNMDFEPNMSHEAGYQRPTLFIPQ
jgi:hypothetical protein